MNTLFDERKLPLSEFQRLGLVSHSNIELDPRDINALLMGRRTGLITVRNLDANGLKIEKIDLKLSLYENADGKLSLGLHPIFRSPQQHELLQGYDADPLMDGTISNLHKVYGKGKGGDLEAVIEYDPQTRSFVAYDPRQVQTPFAVNGITLTEQQADDFRRGVVVDLGDGTKFQHRASERLGVVANRKELVYSFGEPGPFQHIYIHGIPNIPLARSPQLASDTLAFRMVMQENEVADYSTLSSSELSSEHMEALPKARR